MLTIGWSIVSHAIRSQVACYLGIHVRLEDLLQSCSEEVGEIRGHGPHGIFQSLAGSWYCWRVCFTMNWMWILESSESLGPGAPNLAGSEDGGEGANWDTPKTNKNQWLIIIFPGFPVRNGNLVIDSTTFSGHARPILLLFILYAIFWARGTPASCQVDLDPTRSSGGKLGTGWDFPVFCFLLANVFCWFWKKVASFSGILESFWDGGCFFLSFAQGKDVPDILGWTNHGPTMDLAHIWDMKQSNIIKPGSAIVVGPNL